MSEEHVGTIELPNGDRLTFTLGVSKLDCRHYFHIGDVYLRSIGQWLEIPLDALPKLKDIVEAAIMATAKRTQEEVDARQMDLLQQAADAEGK